MSRGRPSGDPGTRSRILETAWALVRERGANAVTVAEIAASAGVTRQLIYVHFESRAGLLVAMARHHDVRSGFRDRLAATRSLPPVEALEAHLRTWFAYIPNILPVARALEAAATTGDEGASAWRDRMDDLRRATEHAVRRVATDGRLAPGWTVEAAADWVWARSHLTVWQHLVEERGWNPAHCAEHCVRSILAEVVTAG